MTPGEYCLVVYAVAVAVTFVVSVTYFAYSSDHADFADAFGNPDIAMPMVFIFGAAGLITAILCPITIPIAIGCWLKQRSRKNDAEEQH